MQSFTKLFVAAAVASFAAAAPQLIPGLPSPPIPSLPLPSLPIPSLPIPSLPILSLPIPSLPVPSLPVLSSLPVCLTGSLPDTVTSSLPAGLDVVDCSATQTCTAVTSAVSIPIVGSIVSELPVGVGLCT